MSDYVNTFIVVCINDVPGDFEKGKEYVAFWDGDGYNEPKLLLAKEPIRNQNHIIAEHTLDDNWFKTHFSVKHP